MIPDGLVGAEFNLTELVVVPNDGQARPVSSWVSDSLLWGGQSCAFLAWTTFAAVRRRILVQGCIQAQARNDGHRGVKGLTSVQKIQGRIGTVAHDDKCFFWQPPPQLKHKLSRPIRHLFRLPSARFVVALRWGQSR